MDSLVLVWWMTICALTKEQQQAVNVALTYSYVHCVSVNKCISFSVSTVVSYLLEKCKGWGPCWKRKTDFRLHVGSSGTIPKVLWTKWGLCASSTIHSATIGQNLHRITLSNTFTLLYKEAADIYSYSQNWCSAITCCYATVILWCEGPAIPHRCFRSFRLIRSLLILKVVSLFKKGQCKMINHMVLHV